MIDSHCHLADDVFAADLDAVIARAKEAGLERAMIILAAGDEKEAAQALRVAALWPDCRFAIGVRVNQSTVFGKHFDMTRAAATSGQRAKIAMKRVAK